MFDSFVWKVALLFLVYFANKEVSSNDECDANSSSGRAINLSINSRRNKTGEWVTTFSARRESKGTSNDINMEVEHNFTNCKGKHIVHIRGVIRETPTVGIPLLFHPKCGTNVKIINDGRTVEKIDLNEGFNAVAITNRPLGIEELFQVRLDKRSNKITDAIGIGVTTHSPDKIEIPRHMNSMSSGTWLMYLNNVYHNGSLIKSNFMKNLKEVKVGERVAVKRTNAGNLHLYINDVDQGVAANNVPSEIYGVFELYQDAAMGTIIDSN